MSKISPGVLSPPREVLTPDEWQARGRARRERVSLAEHSYWDAPSHRPDPVSILEKQAKTRVQDLVPIRYGRMLTSAFAYYRGAAAPMAWDLGHLPTPELRVQCCGDAHLLNFGMFAAPDRRLVFDVNDFDETLPAPFEWDVKRLAASFAVVARDNQFPVDAGYAAARRCANSYRTRMARFANMRFLNVWYSRINVDQVTRLYDAVQSKKAVRRRHRDIRKAQQRTSLKAMTKFCDQIDGEYKIRPDHPMIIRFPIERNPEMLNELRSAVALYQETLPADRREVLRRYYFGDFARKVVGVGSVGTEAFVLLLLGDRADEPLFLQVKEAQESVLAPFAGPSEYQHQGERVARGQRMIQAATDEFLGWTRGVGSSGHPERKDYYVRQLRDMKGSMDVPAMDQDQLIYYAELCGWSLARGHARTGRATLISGYLGTTSEFDKAIAEFSVAYAEQNEKDFQCLVDAVATGRIQAVMGLLSGASPEPSLTGPLLPRGPAPGPGVGLGLGPCDVAAGLCPMPLARRTHAVAAMNGTAAGRPPRRGGPGVNRSGRPVKREGHSVERDQDADRAVNEDGTGGDHDDGTLRYRPGRFWKTWHAAGVTELEFLRDRMRQFARDRDWGRFHDPKSVILALVGEVGELAELFQWLPAADAQALAQDQPLNTRAGEEMADVLLYLVLLADILGIDLGAAALAKMDDSERRFPA
jgi:uncharacterized protein (DUF2252 family)/NTP pyrophosphatase (non-canonical NTP hydrolase)